MKKIKDQIAVKITEDQIQLIKERLENEKRNKKRKNLKKMVKCFEHLNSKPNHATKPYKDYANPRVLIQQ